MTAHSKIGASSMHRWAHCPGSVKLCDGLPRKATAASAEGTCAHAIAEKILRGGRFPRLGSKLEADGFTFTFNAEMRDAVKLYKKTVDADTIPGDTVAVEQAFHLESIHPDLFGTADCVIWSPAQQILTVLDFKYGAGVPVEAAGNPQLKYYALGALLQLAFPAKQVDVVIVQPRCAHADGPVRRASYSAMDLLDFAGELSEAALATEAADAPLVVGDWCQFCPAKAICAALKAQAQAIAKDVFSAPVAKEPPPPAAFTPDELAYVLRRAPTVEMWIKAVREYAYQQAEDGKPVPGFKLVDKLANRKLKPDASLGMLADVAEVQVEDLYVKKLKGIGDIEKLMPGKNAAARAEALAPFVVRESSGHVLVPETDKRPAVVRDPQATAKLVFQPE